VSGASGQAGAARPSSGPPRSSSGPPRSSSAPSGIELYPAVDISDGRAVRLVQGDFGRRSDYGDPVEAATRLAAEGPSWLHVVDLDAARAGRPVNTETVAAIVRAVAVPVQAGGGVRDEAAAEALLGAGVARIVVGTAALFRPDLVARLAGADPARVAVGLDYRVTAGGGRHLAVRGWSDTSGTELRSALADLEACGLATVVVTAIDRDGTLAGPDLAGLADVLASTRMAVVASGGVGSLDDVSALAGLRGGGRGLSGAIVGRALYEGRFSLREALEAAGARAAVAAPGRPEAGEVTGPGGGGRGA
jgi:phosphoribosylformimino-5-aminoimidazole carboxamide ribotide isomerase